MSLDARARILISGLVQGVFFRRGIADLARQLSVTGWVRNLRDGSVEVVCEGDKDKLDRVVQFCRVGPSGARVKNVDVDWFDFRGDFRGFKIIR
ncbi:acylphosphatase [Candidatus Bathyarchaeota archaeon]|nr:MAG: acylphosphatase [Candidatus Bathyarchaeota archaeon]